MDMTCNTSSPTPCPESRRGNEPTRRRRFDRQPRSRTGCITCRARHKRCDERTPTCRNCESLNIRCEGYNAQLRWQDKYMRMADIPDTSYRSLRYVNISRERFSEQMEKLMEEFSPYDVDHHEDDCVGHVKEEIVELDETAYMYSPTVFTSPDGLDSHNLPQYNLSHHVEPFANGFNPKVVSYPDMFPITSSQQVAEVNENNYLYMAPANVSLNGEYIYAAGTVLPGSSMDLIQSLEPQVYYG
ncbi:hypothetical protein V1509DRAFT_175729 [Lipomyces kononenkoae]